MNLMNKTLSLLTLSTLLLAGCTVNQSGATCQGLADEGSGGVGGSGGGESARPCDLDSDCSDGDPCTEDRCAGHACEHVQTCTCPIECAPDGDAQSQKKACDDGNPNTLDRCVSVDLCPLGSCAHAGVRCDWLDPPATQVAVCNDSDPCTVDYCEKDKFGPDLGLCRNDALADCP